MLQNTFGIGLETNGSLIIFSLPQERLSEVSLALADENISVTSMTLGEKSLEETFLELTGSQGTGIS